MIKWGESTFLEFVNLFGRSLDLWETISGRLTSHITLKGSFLDSTGLEILRELARSSNTTDINERKITNEISRELLSEPFEIRYVQIKYGTRISDKRMTERNETTSMRSLKVSENQGLGSNASSIQKILKS